MGLMGMMCFAFQIENIRQAAKQHNSLQFS